MAPFMPSCHLFPIHLLKTPDSGILVGTVIRNPNSTRECISVFAECESEYECLFSVTCVFFDCVMSLICDRLCVLSRES